MSWVEKRINQYQQGQKPTWLEKRALEHGHPVHAALALISLPFACLWVMDSFLVVDSSRINFKLYRPLDNSKIG